MCVHCLVPASKGEMSHLCRRGRHGLGLVQPGPTGGPLYFNICCIVQMFSGRNVTGIVFQHIVLSRLNITYVPFTEENNSSCEKMRSRLLVWHCCYHSTAKTKETTIIVTKSLKISLCIFHYVIEIRMLTSKIGWKKILKNCFWYFNWKYRRLFLSTYSMTSFQDIFQLFHYTKRGKNRRKERNKITAFD